MPVVDAPADLDDLALLTAAAEAAADLALGYFRQDPKVWQKDNASPVSEADIAVDRFLRATLMAARPDYGWLSEETEDDEDRLGRRRVFVVDPIDGTRGFLAGSDEWTVSLAVVEAGRPITAALIQPATAKLFTARVGEGAWIGGRPLVLQERAALADARVAGPATLTKPLRRLHGPMRDGGYVASLALRIALVAEGRIDLALARPDAHDWDIAAADLVLAEAGGKLLGAGGSVPIYNRPIPRHPILVAAHAELAEDVAAMIATIKPL